MDSRLVALCLAVVLITAGCLSGTPIDDSGPRATTDSTSVETTTSTTDAHLTEKSLPDHPENLTHENAVQFVEEYERAYKWNQEFTNDTTELTVNPTRVTVLNATETGFVIHLEVGFSKTVLQGGDEVVGSGFYTANYLVNETVVMRTQTAGEVRPGPDPRNGTVVET